MITSLEKLIKQYDRSNMLGSITALPDQCRAAFDTCLKISLPKSYKKVSSIVMAGMGGSGLASHIITSLFKDQLKIPFVILQDYHLPAFVNSSTLFFAISYSGNTEETLRTTAEAIKRKAKIIGITTGGKLGAMLKKAKLPAYIFDPIFNPSKQPRMAAGYLLSSQLAFLSRSGFLKISKQEIQTAIPLLKTEQKRFEPNIRDNPAIKIASSFQGKIPILLAGEFLTGNFHIFANQINENAKTFAVYFTVPEINHHLLEGLSEPKNIRQFFIWLIIHSDLYSQKLLQTLPITEKILLSQGFCLKKHKLLAKTKFLQIFEALMFSSFVAFYLAILQKYDPSLIPWVNFFKSELSKK